MTERLAETTRRVENLQQLEAVVTAMRGISASRTQQAHGLLLGLRTHTAVIAGAISQALALMPEDRQPATARTRRTAVIVFCAEQGFAGAFNDRMLDAIGTQKDTRDIFLIGTRGATLARERGIPLAWQSAMVPHATLVAALAGRIADALYDWLSDQAGRRVDVLVPTWTAGGGIMPEQRSLLPFDFRRFAVSAPGQPPLITLAPPVLLARLAEEYVFAELCEAALTAFAAENEARVAAMLSAKGNLENMRSDLQALERQIRQEEITAEVVELASGAAARRDVGIGQQSA
ncbi:MAG: F0F1 ATP synthase subunit gamma [Rhodopila sp.]|nr:F0F1 ATP synthase subunit gamma [Rhodopila sp.]